MLPAADDERCAVDEGPDAPVLPEEEADAAEPLRGEGHERAAVDEGRVGDTPADGVGQEPVEPVALQLGAGPALPVHDEHRALAVEQQRAPLGAPQPARVGDRQPRHVLDGVGDHDAVREAVRLDPRPAQLDQVLEDLGQQPRRLGRARPPLLAEQLDDDGVPQGPAHRRVERPGRVGGHPCERGAGPQRRLGDRRQRSVRRATGRREQARDLVVEVDDHRRAPPVEQDPAGAQGGVPGGRGRWPGRRRVVAQLDLRVPQHAAHELGRRHPHRVVGELTSRRRPSRAHPRSLAEGARLPRCPAHAGRPVGDPAGSSRRGTDRERAGPSGPSTPLWRQVQALSQRR